MNPILTSKLRQLKYVYVHRYCEKNYHATGQSLEMLTIYLFERPLTLRIERYHIQPLLLQLPPPRPSTPPPCVTRL